MTETEILAEALTGGSWPCECDDCGLRWVSFGEDSCPSCGSNRLGVARCPEGALLVEPGVEEKPAVWRRACAVAACRFYREPGKSGQFVGHCEHDDQGHKGCPRHRKESAGTLMTGGTREAP